MQCVTLFSYVCDTYCSRHLITQFLKNREISEIKVTRKFRVIRFFLQSTGQGIDTAQKNKQKEINPRSIF